MPSPRRFPGTITRRRQGVGDRNTAGEYVPGTMTETDFRASVQPLELEDSDIAGGASLEERLRVYVPVPDALMAAFDDREADEVVYDGTTYTVEESRSWPGSHTRATILRAT